MISFRRPPMWELVRTYKLIVDIVIYQKIRASRGGSDVQRFWATWDVNVAAHVTRHLNFLQRIIALRILQVRHSSTFSLLFFFLSFFSFISPPLPSPLIFSRMKKKRGRKRKERKKVRERERKREIKQIVCVWIQRQLRNYPCGLKLVWMAVSILLALRFSSIESAAPTIQSYDDFMNIDSVR